MSLEAIAGLIMAFISLVGLILMFIIFIIPLKREARLLNENRISGIAKELTDCKLLRGDVTNEKFNKLISEFEVAKNESENILENLHEFKTETHDNFKIVFNSISGLEQSNVKILEKLDNLAKCVDGMDRKNGKSG